ncbi:hypothetical protein CERSUDRAFT_84660 [Gelatoporia subvermispora B]|uniref:Uncharacterized protein n=1 Tax=Ceriporiopsis subvermispora (strain B) TaxID=914234 RepID=M2RCH7_CERS8|nr:hypothetical protein CERSUDRAFT_84660 [Gelatoporia subvermispora B]
MANRSMWTRYRAERQGVVEDGTIVRHGRRVQEEGLRVKHAQRCSGMSMLSLGCPSILSSLRESDPLSRLLQGPMTSCLWTVR